MSSDVRIRLRGRLAELLQELALAQGVDVGTVLSRALSHEATLLATERGGGHVVLHAGDGRRRRLVLDDVAGVTASPHSGGATADDPWTLASTRHARPRTAVQPNWSDPTDETTVEITIPAAERARR